MTGISHPDNRALKLAALLLLLAALALSACQFPISGAIQPDPTAVLPTQIALAAPPTSQPISSPTPLPTLPPPATAVPPPTPLYNPALAEWTILVYMTADNNLALSALRDLNEMEAAGSSARVNVVAQIDLAAQVDRAAGDEWSGGRRYLLRGDADPNALASDLLAELGEINMGDPQTLADFVAWGMRTYPANRTALFLWDHGAGWNGIAFDSGAPFGPDHLSLADLQGGLAAGLAESGAVLDVIAFDACLMGQLDVLAAVQDHARYAVASEELTPGQGWNYRSWLGQLFARPELDGGGLARLLVDDFAAAYTQLEPDDFVTMAAVDLQKLPALIYAVESLAQTLLADPAFVGSAVGDARSGAEAFARVYADEFERYAAVDLGHFARILAQRSPSEPVTAAAVQVEEALTTAVLANRHGSGFKNSSGIAIYFPRSREFYADSYGAGTPLKLWDQFLTSYHTTSFAELPPPAVHLAPVTADSVGVQNPAYLDFEIVGRDIANVALIGGYYGEDGRRRLVEYDNLIPEPTHLPDGSSLSEWRDGVHEDFFIWDTEITYLVDALGAGDYVVMWPTAPGSSLYTVQGQLRRAEGSTFPANLVFDHKTDRLTRVWSLGDGSAAAEIAPQPGDTFQVDTLYLDENDALVREPGAVLTFDEAGDLYFEWRALPNGRYFIGFEAQNAAGDTDRTTTDIVVDNENLVAGYTAYLDPYLGFQFLHPADWYMPVYSDTLLYTSSRSSDTHLQVTLYPHLEAGVNPLTLKNQTLAGFGPVDVLYQDEIVVGSGDGRQASVGGQQAAYGYEKAGSGPRTGLFFTFVRNGQGYVVDVDGPQELEAQTIAAVQQLQRSWRFTDQGFGLKPGEWAKADLAAFSVAHPLDFRYQAQGDWQRFVADGHTFVALRAQPETRPSPEVLAALVRDAGNGVEGFTAERPFAFPLGGAVWDRVNFAYTALDGTETWGFIMTRVSEGQEIVAWAEAPAAAYNELEPTVFLTVIADMRVGNG